MEPAPTWSGQAIRDASQNPSALATTLPEPALHALRPECTPGVVAAARVATPEPEPQEAPTIEGHNLDEFPALGAFLRNSPSRRLRTSTIPKQEGRFTQLAKRGINALMRNNARTANPKRVRPVKIEGDDLSLIHI